jgi:hypothetical protein
MKKDLANTENNQLTDTYIRQKQTKQFRNTN